MTSLPSSSGSTETRRWTIWRWPDNDSKWCWLVDLPSADIPSAAVDVTPVMPVSEHNRLREISNDDRVVQAAVRMRNHIRAAIGPVDRGDAEAVQAVIDAVNEAGL